MIDRFNLYRFASPATFYPLAGKLIPWFAAAGVLFGLAGLIAVAFPQVNLFAMFLLFLSDPLRRLISRRLKPLPSTAS